MSVHAVRSVCTYLDISWFALSIHQFYKFVPNNFWSAWNWKQHERYVQENRNEKSLHSTNRNSKSGWCSRYNTHTHTHTHAYTYIHTHTWNLLKFSGTRNTTLLGVSFLPDCTNMNIADGKRGRIRIVTILVCDMCVCSVCMHVCVCVFCVCVCKRLWWRMAPSLFTKQKVIKKLKNWANFMGNA